MDSAAVDSTTMDAGQRAVLILTPFDSDVDDVAAVVPDGTLYQRCVNLTQLVDALRGGAAAVVVALKKPSRTKLSKTSPLCWPGNPSGRVSLFCC